MQKFKLLACFLITFFTFIPAIKGQDSSFSRIAILPFYSNGIDPVYIGTAESILQVQISKLSTMDIISAKRTRESIGDEECIESDCAIEIGEKLDADRVLGCKISALGEKIFVHYFLVDIPSGKEILIDQIAANSVEELETVMKRVAKSVVVVKPVAEVVEVGNIVEQESEESLRRTSNKNVGLSFGYLYPQNGYDDSERSFVVNLHLDYELEEFAAGMLLGIRKGFAINVYGDYLLTKTDVCPFIGGAFGFHWISHSGHYNAYTNEYEDKRGDGFELTANAGMRILHTYNFQILINLEYIYTMNEYDDGAIVFTIGIL